MNGKMGYCESCDNYDDDLRKLGGRMLCRECRERRFETDDTNHLVRIELPPPPPAMPTEPPPKPRELEDITDDRWVEAIPSFPPGSVMQDGTEIEGALRTLARAQGWMTGGKRSSRDNNC
jgi:hypothetical protein